MSMREESRIAILRAWREEIAASYESADAWRQSIMEGQLQADEHTQEKLALLADFEHSMMAIDATRIKKVEKQLSRVRRPEFLNSWLDRGHWAQGELLAKQILKQQAVEHAIAAERVRRRKDRDAVMQRLLKVRTSPADSSAPDAETLMDGAAAADGAGADGLQMKRRTAWDSERLAKMATAKQPKPYVEPKGKEVKKLSADQLATMLERHYKLIPEQQEAKRKKTREKILKESGALKGKTVTLTGEQLEQFVLRHAVDAPKLHEKNLDTLRKKVLKESQPKRRIGDGTVDVDAFAQRIDDHVTQLAYRRRELLLKAERERAALMGTHERAVLYGDAIERSAAHLFDGVGAAEDLVSFEQVAVNEPFEATGWAAAMRGRMSPAERVATAERSKSKSKSRSRQRPHVPADPAATVPPDVSASPRPEATEGAPGDDVPDAADAV